MIHDHQIIVEEQIMSSDMYLLVCCLLIGIFMANIYFMERFVFIHFDRCFYLL